jgi:hypothetical protein
MKFRFHREIFVPAVSLGGMEHPAIQSETATEGAKGRRACAAADQLAMPRQKKLKVFKF